MRFRTNSAGRLIAYFLLSGAGIMIAWCAVQVLFVEFGWRERTAKFEEMIATVAPVGIVVGLYVAWHATQRLTNSIKEREQMRAEFHDQAEAAGTRSKHS